MLPTREKINEAQAIYKELVSINPKDFTDIQNLKYSRMVATYYKLAEAYSSGSLIEARTEGEIEKIMYDLERKTCALKKCDKTCPAYPENDNFPCGVKLRAKQLAHALVGKV